MADVVDLKQTIRKETRPIFKALPDIDFFKTFSLDSWTVVWSNNADFSPEFLYDLVLLQNEVADK